MTYQDARDQYGKMNKDKRNAVLDRISQKTNAHSGAEAEQAFIDSVIEINNEPVYPHHYPFPFPF